jgi:hypothetical protein
MVPIRVVHSCYNTTISEGGVWGRVSDGLYKTPNEVFPPQGVACGAEGGTADFRITASGAATTSPPEGVFHSILHKKNRRAVGTHYGPTLIRLGQARFSLCHRRDGRAGTTIL